MNQESVYPQCWDNQHIYPGLDSLELEADLALARRRLGELADFMGELTTACEEPGARLTFLRKVRQRAQGIRNIGWNIAVLAASAASQNAQDPLAKTQASRARALNADLFKTLAPMEQLLLTLPDADFDALMADALLGEEAFRLRHERQLADRRLPVVAEQLVIGLSSDGLHAWGNLYSELAGRLRLRVEGRELGLAQASNLLSSGDRALRQQAQSAISHAWEGEQETVAAILNAINGWRLELARQRGAQSGRPLDALSLSCHQNRIERVTLDAMMSASYERRELGQRALGVMGRRLGIKRMSVADLAAPAVARPGQGIPFAQAIDWIAEAFASFDPEMGDFARMMAERGWIDAAPSPHRQSGAYCTKFADPVEPRVFLTYEGSMRNLVTLAHELGHAWHNWLLRDLPMSQRAYPMTLAETASIFAETLVRSALFERAEEGDREAIAWMEADSAATFLLNIPARFDFEQALVRERDQGYVGSVRLKALMDDAWGRWYEQSLEEYFPLFWAAKGHFAIPGLGFYNYPYLFGYLFSLGVYGQLMARKGAGETGVAQAYRALLRDTGRMSAEALVTKHLGLDIRTSAFWQQSLDRVEEAVNRFADLSQWHAESATDVTRSS